MKKIFFCSIGFLYPFFCLCMDNRRRDSVDQLEEWSHHVIIDISPHSTIHEVVVKSFIWNLQKRQPRLIPQLQRNLNTLWLRDLQGQLSDLQRRFNNTQDNAKAIYTLSCFAIFGCLGSLVYFLM